jgi:phage gpG-like protein
MEAKDRWLGEIAMRVSAGGVKLVADEFRASEDPYGKPWAPLKRPRPRDRKAARRAIAKGRTPRGPKVLIHTGRMRMSVGASSSGRTARVVVPTWYARFHQEGTTSHPFRSFSKKRLSAKMMAREGQQHIPQRMILPLVDRLPSTWDTMIGREARAFMAQRFGVR